MVGAKVCELTDGFLWFVCGNFDVSPNGDGILLPNPTRNSVLLCYRRVLWEGRLFGRLAVWEDWLFSLKFCGKIIPQRLRSLSLGTG